MSHCNARIISFRCAKLNSADRQIADKMKAKKNYEIEFNVLKEGVTETQRNIANKVLREFQEKQISEREKSDIIRSILKKSKQESEYRARSLTL